MHLVQDALDRLRSTDWVQATWLRELPATRVRHARACEGRLPALLGIFVATTFSSAGPCYARLLGHASLW